MPTLSLTSRDLARLETATRVLLSPLALPDVDSWRTEAMRTVCAVFAADQATFVMPGASQTIKGFGMDEASVARVDEYIADSWSGRGTSPDPLLDTFHRIATEQRIEVWDMDVGARVLGYRSPKDLRNPYMHEVLIPEFMDDTISLFVPWERGTAHLAVHRLMRSAEPGEHLPVLRLLLPSFKAGLATLAQFSAWRQTLDAVVEPLAVFDPDGMELHRNAALRDLLGADPEAYRIEAALTRLARQIRPIGFSLHAGSAAPVAPVGEVQTARMRYELRATLLGPGAYSPDGSVLVSVQAERAGGRELPPAEDVRARFPLSRREAEVALLVAQGLTNEQIAETLFVSVHTVRHHVEAVMAKLDLSGRRRSAVAARILNAEPLTA